MAYRSDIPPELRLTYHLLRSHFPEWVTEYRQHRYPYCHSFAVREKSLINWYELHADEITSILNNGKLRSLVDESISKLQYPKQEIILGLRYGLEDGEVWSLKEIGRKFKVTYGTIRQQELKAFKRLSHRSRSGELRNYIKQCIN